MAVVVAVPSPVETLASIQLQPGATPRNLLNPSPTPAWLVTEVLMT
jgi:hypothetical protein